MCITKTYTTDSFHAAGVESVNAVVRAIMFAVRYSKAKPELIRVGQCVHDDEDKLRNMHGYNRAETSLLAQIVARHSMFCDGGMRMEGLCEPACVLTRFVGEPLLW